MTDKAEVEDFLAGFDPPVAAIARSARELVLDVLPDALETLEGGDLGYGVGPGYKGLVFVVTPMKAAAKIGIVGGASLPDPAGLLRGTGRVHRHVRLESEADVRRPELRELMEAGLAARRS